MAQGDGNRVVRNAPYRMTFPMFDTSWALLTSLTTPDSEYSVDGAGVSDCTNEATAIGATGWYTLDLTATEMTGDEIAIKVDSADAAIPHMEVLHPEPCLDSGVAQGSANTSLTLRAAASAVDSYYEGGVIEIVRGTGAGQVRSCVSYTGSSKIAGIDRAWETNPDSSSVYIVHGSAIGMRCNSFMQVNSNVERVDDNSTAGENFALVYKGGMVSGTIDDATPTVSGFDGDSGLSSTNDWYNGMMLVITSGTCIGLARRVSDYVGATNSFSFVSDFPAAPANGDTFFLHSHSS